MTEMYSAAHVRHEDWPALEEKVKAQIEHSLRLAGVVGDVTFDPLLDLALDPDAPRFAYQIVGRGMKP